VAVALDGGGVRLTLAVEYAVALLPRDLLEDVGDALADELGDPPACAGCGAATANAATTRSFFMLGAICILRALRRDPVSLLWFW
jgi:hypothetical protein